MGLMDKLAEGAERAAKEAEKAFDKGKTKVGELQVEMQMDGLAKKLGYLVFDFYRGRQVDQALRQKILDDLSRLEDQLLRARAEAAAKAQPEAAKAQPEAAAAAAATGAEAADPTSNPVDVEAGSPAAATAEAASDDDQAPVAGDSPPIS